MPSAALLLEEAFGKHMLAGAAEWRDVPDVVRSSLYVLQKVLRHLDARLSRIEADKSSALLATLHTSMRRVEADCQRVVTDTVTAATTPLQASLARLKKAVGHRLQAQQGRRHHHVLLRDLTMPIEAAMAQTQALTTQLEQLQAHAREAEDAYKHKLDELGRRAATHAGSLAHYDMLEKLEMRCKTLERQVAAALPVLQERPAAPLPSDGDHAMDEAPTDESPSGELVVDVVPEAASIIQAYNVVLAPTRLLTLREKREASRIRFEEAARRQKARWATQRDETQKRGCLTIRATNS